MIIEIDNDVYNIDIIKKKNKNTYIRVKNGEIVVTTNYLVSKNSIKKLINDNIDSIKKMMESDKRKNDKEEEFYYFGKKYNIIYGFNEIEIVDDKIYASNIKDMKRYLDNEIHRIYSERLNYWYGVFMEKIPVPNLKIRKMTSRWGVCNIKNYNVTLNYQLSKYNIRCLDYVIVHELSHFVYPNHSRDFWNLVGKYYPNYKECRKELKE